MGPPGGGGSHRDRFVRPNALFLGVACAFAACCLAGRQVSRHNFYRDFVRFHPLVNPQSLYRPTASQLLALAESQLGPDQVAVVIAGNSVLKGYGQGPEDLWSGHLQRLLGGRYRVLNFAMNGAHPADFGALAAEALGRRHARVVCVTNTWPGAGAGERSPDDGSQPYFFWDAYYKGLLTDYPTREADLAEQGRRRHDKPYAEARRHGRADALFRFDDLWTAVGYRGVTTVWSPWAGESFWKPRRSFADPEQSIPPERRYGPTLPAPASALHRTLGARRWVDAPPAPTDADRRRSPLARYSTLSFPQPLRRRTLVVVSRASPRLVEGMDAATLARYRADFPETVRTLEQAGFAVLDQGDGYAEMDYVDYAHLSPEGAVKLAAAVAPRVRELSREWNRGD